MFDSPLPAVLVALPGSGSDAYFVRQSFAAACIARGIEFIAVEPDPTAVVAGYRAALDDAASRGPVLVAGISLGAAVALDWAHRRPDAAVGVVAALPAWTGANTADCPAALSAATTAAQLRAEGLEPVLERMRVGSPPWLAEALTRSWRAHGPLLPDALEEAAQYKWPDAGQLETLPVPMAVITAVDDPVHPVAVAREWAHRAPRATLIEITLDELGADPAVLGHTGLRVFDRRDREPGGA
ncbi:serine aminopeptidase domain-containing protein [Nocardia paucivorans]|uniref:serine aminopeptidase domain-containing protein n=1 Tax=Nocardia paucivorans TaxID=114259 RepID=UPI001FE06356|nr:alpha/beta hydrolase [Nocardia paucivorans]